MNKIHITNYRLVFSTLFFIFLFSTNISAQIVLDTATVETKTISCSSSTSFTDDNLNSGLYFDEKARKDSVVICPSSSGRQVKVTFSSFGIASGDLLTVYDGDITKNSGASSQTASGNGTSNAFGGWVAANCDPAANPTGCLTFVFETNGDNNKSTGWQANITCESSGTTVQCPSNISVVDNCNNLDGMVSVTIPKPTFTTCGGSANAMVTITSSCSVITGGNFLADGSNLGTFTIPLGTHSITATSVADDSKSCTYFVIADQPAITCNDNLTSSIGLGCTARIGVDDIIENPCVGSGTSYIIKINLGSKGGGSKSATVDGTSFSTLSSGGLDIPSSDFNCGSTYSVEITRTVSFTGCGGPNSVSKSCTGSVKFVDNSPPSISFSAQTLTTCGNLTDEEVKRKLTISVFDNCEVEDTIVSVGAFPSNFCSSNLTVPITITAIDFCGNSKTETFNVNITRPTNFYRPNDTLLNCGSGYSPEIAGYPLLDTDGDNVGDLIIGDNTCNFTSIYTDQVVTANNSRTKKIFRTWQIKDWCNQSTPVTLDPQLIEIKDTGKPSINCPSSSQKGGVNNPYNVYVSGNNCTGTIDFSSPTANDDCGGNVTVSFDEAVDISDNSTFNTNTNLPIGNYYALYVGKDESGNRSDPCKVYFNVSDRNAPQAVCTDALNVSFVNNSATIRVADVDAGSDDNCGGTTKEIRKEGGLWGQTVSLTCEEIENNGKIYLRVTDNNGQQNTCWTQITAKDSTVPECDELADQTLSCEDYHNDQFGNSTDTNNNKDFDDSEWQSLTGNLQNAYNDAFGNPNCSDNLTCGAANIEQEYQVVAANCGETKIKRRYRATDNSTNQSSWKEQLVTLISNQAFSVTFPSDWEGSCNDNFPEPSINIATGGCSILAWSHEDKQFDGVNDACYLIQRTYTVSNWCFHIPGETPVVISRTEDEQGFSTGATTTHEDLNNVGAFQYTQILKIRDAVAPVITVNAVDVCITADDCTAIKSFSISAQDCVGDKGLTFSYELIENETVIQSGASASFSATVEAKTYEVKFSASDNCGNTDWISNTYTFKDCSAPSAFCLDGIASVVDANGNAQVWATDLNQKSLDNCSPEDNLELRVYHPTLGDGVIKPQIGDAAAVVLALPKSVTLTCDQIGSQSVELYVIDEAGNWDFCVASVLIQDGSGACGNILIDTDNVAMVAGGILNAATNIPLAGVNFTAKGTLPYEQTFTTDDSGIFSLNLPKGIGYLISIDKEDNMANGLTTFDIIQVSKHILGITPFSADWQLLAADMNRSGSVTAFDLLLMRKIILGQEDNSNNLDSWRFMPANTPLGEENMVNGVNLSEAISIPVLNENLTELDYLAVKIGDLNGSAKTDGFLLADDRNKSKPLVINITDRKVKQGEAISIPLQTNDFSTLQGIQFGLQFDGLSLNNIEYGMAQNQHIAFSKKDELRISWDKYSAEQSENEVLFTLHFTAQKAAYLSELLNLSKNMLPEVIGEDEKISSIALNFEKNKAVNNFQLYQNTPNPFTTTTIIGFELAKKEAISLEIFNLQGSLLKQIRGTYDKGIHQIPINKSDLKGNGVLIYQLTTANSVASRKMILLE